MENTSPCFVKQVARCYWQIYFFKKKQIYRACLYLQKKHGDHIFYEISLIFEFVYVIARLVGKDSKTVKSEE